MKHKSETSSRLQTTDLRRKNASWLTWTLLLLLFISGCSKQSSFPPATNNATTNKPVQQTEADHKAVEEIKAKADNGDPLAQFNVGVRYMSGEGVNQDAVEAVKWYRKAAEQGYAEAQLNLGWCYFNGCGVSTNLVEAVDWYRKAAEQGNATAQNSLGVCYQKGDGVPKDNVEAVKWYRKATEQGDARAQLYLGLCYYYGDGVPKDYVEANKWVYLSLIQGVAEARQILTEIEALMTPDQLAAAHHFEGAQISAKKGDVLGQYALGVFYVHGEGVAQDYVEAAKWFRKAADQGFARAQHDLGLCYENGDGVTKDVTEAVKWYHKAADQGDASAQYGLGLCYAKGNGVEKDFVEAVKWWLKAADQGDASAQKALGLCYARGDGVATNFVEAAKWYHKAADQGDASAQYKLGLFYFIGRGVPSDYAEAVKWYRKAAEQGDSGAQCQLGIMFEDGKGVPQDYIEAYKWYNLAAAGGVAKVSEFRSLLAEKMTPEQIAEAQRRSAKFVPREETPGATSDNFTSPGNPTASGTGFFITDDGYLITNNHVVKDATQVRLVTSAGTIAAKVVRVDGANDLALLKAEGKFSPLPIAASRTAHLGGTVATVGFPNIGMQGFSPKLAKGEIASLSGATDDVRYFQISVPVQPGNSGGALVDERGNVIGIVSAKLDASAALAATGALPENVNYAVKSSFLLSFLESTPDVSAKLKAPISAERTFDDVVNSAQQAAVLVLVY